MGSSSDTKKKLRLFIICRAYVDFGRAHPAGYKILIGQRGLDDWEDRDLAMRQTASIMAAALGLVADAIGTGVEAGESVSTDPGPVPPDRRPALPADY